MEEFVTEIQSNLGGNQNINAEPKTSKYRELFKIIINSSIPEIKIVEKCNEEGDVKFEVPIRSLGLTNELFEKYKREISSDFAANFIGEFLVKENISEFSKILPELKENYTHIVNKYIHRKFGMFTIRDRLMFVFNINLIQKLLTEDFKKNII